MLIALDYDGTYSLNPPLFNRTIELYRSVGWRVICVTCRQDTEENRNEVICPGVPRYFTGGSPKRWYLEQRGIRPDIWIENEPETIIYGL